MPMEKVFRIHSCDVEVFNVPRLVDQRDLLYHQAGRNLMIRSDKVHDVMRKEKRERRKERTRETLYQGTRILRLKWA